MLQVVSVIIYKDKAYVPTQGLDIEGPFYICLEPIHTSILNNEDLARAILSSYEAGNVPLEIADYSEYHKHDPVLKVTKARSWKQLAKSGASYGITWSRESITIAMSKLDEKGRFVDDPAKEVKFAFDTSIEKIAQTILNDFRTRSFA